MNLVFKFKSWLYVSCLFSALVLLTGCETIDPTPAASNSAKSGPDIGTDILYKGDVVIVIFSGSTEAPPRHEDRIRDDGQITLPFVGDVEAAGKTRAELQNIIYKLYVPKYFKQLTVNVNSDVRYFTVQGEVKKPDRYPYVGRVTVLHAITSAGDFTDFAKRTKVKVIRSNGKTETVNCEAAQSNPKLDVPIYPDDRVFVPRRLW